MAILLASVQAVRTGTTYPVNIAATSTTATQTINSQFVRLSPRVSVYYNITATGIAAATTGLAGPFLAAGVVEFVRCQTGDTIAAITATGALEAGGLSVAEVIE